MLARFVVGGKAGMWRVGSLVYFEVFSCIRCKVKRESALGASIFRDFYCVCVLCCQDIGAFYSL